LSAANATANLWDPQWEVYQVDVDGAVHVRKRDIHRRAVPGEFSNVGAPGRPVVVGARVALLVQKESLQLQPGFYFAFGSAIGSEFDNAHLSRIYFNVPANHADTLLRLLSAECNRYEIPFSFKCLSDPAGYAAQRADSAVLYVAKRYLQPVLRILTRHAPELEMLLRAKSPMFSKPLFPGVGLADEPGTGESFGQSRSRLVADGLIDAWEHGQHDGVQKLEAVRERFRRQGLDLRRPHLNPGNFDCYQNPKLHESAK
jgi:hypothetical protein